MRFFGKKRSVCYVRRVLAIEGDELKVDCYWKTENSLFKKPMPGDVKFVEREQDLQILPNLTYTGQTAQTLGTIRSECNFNTMHEVN